jgi:hypothetical protein
MAMNVSSGRCAPGADTDVDRLFVQDLAAFVQDAHKTERGELQGEVTGETDRLKQSSSRAKT